MLSLFVTLNSSTHNLLQAQLSMPAGRRAHMAKLIVAFRNFANAPKMRHYGLVASGTGRRQVTGSCEHGNEPSGSTERGKFLDQLRNCWLYQKACNYTHAACTDSAR